jgi:DtxR family manganese transport transcriptional regulator
MKKKANQAKPFIATRSHHGSELAEDYVEIIYDLIENTGEARVRDIATHFGVSHVTVIRSVDRLQKKGYVLTQQHQPITLTPKGKKLAKLCKERHQFLLHYLTSLGVPEEIAQVDVEGMEHHISPQTMEAFKMQLNKLS